MKIKILMPILVLVLLLAGCKKTDEVIPIEKNKVSQTTNTNIDNIGILDEQTTISDFKPKGDEYGCLLMDPATNSVICAGTLCRNGPSKICSIEPCHCINFKGEMPEIKSLKVITLDSENKLKKYKDYIKQND